MATAPLLPGRAQLTSLFLSRSILNEIDVRGLTPGEVLPSEADLAQQFGVSKGSLREALRILEVHGFIRVKSGAGGGPVVSDPTTSAGFARAATMFLQYGRAQVSELLSARIHLEPLMASLAAQSRDKEQLAELRRLIDEGRSANLHNDDEYLSLTTGFHLAIGIASGNQVLSLFARGLLEVFHSRVPGSPVAKSRRATIIDEHERVAKAIFDRDPELAERLMREHVEAFARDIRRRYPHLMNDVIQWT